jgi:hypothetical protein
LAHDRQLAGDGSASRFSQSNLFELALDRLAGGVAAVNRTTKSDTVDFLNRTLADARTDRAGEGDQRTVSARTENCAGKAPVPSLCWINGAFQRGSIRTLPMRRRRHFGHADMKSIPVRTVRIAGLQEE